MDRVEFHRKAMKAFATANTQIHFLIKEYCDGSREKEKDVDEFISSLASVFYRHQIQVANNTTTCKKYGCDMFCECLVVGENGGFLKEGGKQNG